MRILSESHEGVEAPILEVIGAVGDDVLREYPAVPVLLHDFARNGEEGVETCQGSEVGAVARSVISRVKSSIARALTLSVHN